jgi:ribosome-associated protein
LEAKELALAIADAALEKQAEFLEIINVIGKVDYTNYVVICSGRSDRQVEAIVAGVEAALKERQVHPLGVEGRQSAQWVLMDYVDVIFHVFEDHKRGFYDLETLWIDAERLPVRKTAGV